MAPEGRVSSKTVARRPARTLYPLPTRENRGFEPLGPALRLARVSSVSPLVSSSSAPAPANPPARVAPAADARLDGPSPVDPIR